MTELPDSWCRIKIVEVLEPHENGKPFQQGWSPQCEKTPALDGAWGVLKTTAIQEGEFFSFENKALPATLDPRPHLEVKAGDVLMTCAGPRNRCGVTCLIRETQPKLIMSGKMYRFRPDTRKLNAKYLVFYLHSRDAKQAIDRMKTGISDSGLNLTHGRFAELDIPLPPVNEQHRILAKIEELFSELDKGIGSLKTAREQLKVYRHAVLKHAFEGKLTAEWREENKDKLETADQLLARVKQERDARYQQKLGEWQAAVKAWEADDKPGKNPSKPRNTTYPDKPSAEQHQKMWTAPDTWQWLQIGEFAFVTKLAGFEYTKFVQYDDDGDLPVIKAENAGPNGYRITDYSRVHSKSISELTRSHIQGGELLMVFVGAGTGNVATVPKDQKYFLGPNIGMMRPESGAINTRYLELFLRSPLGKDMALSSVKAVAQPSISMGTIRQIPVLLPSTEEQEKMVQKLDEILSEIEMSEADTEEQILKAESLRQSILKKAFSGQLVKQDPDDEPASALLKRIKVEKAAQVMNRKNNKKQHKKKDAA